MRRGGRAGRGDRGGTGTAGTSTARHVPQCPCSPAAFGGQQLPSPGRRFLLPGRAWTTLSRGFSPLPGPAAAGTTGATETGFRGCLRGARSSRPSFGPQEASPAGWTLLGTNTLPEADSLPLPRTPSFRALYALLKPVKCGMPLIKTYYYTLNYNDRYLPPSRNRRAMKTNRCLILGVFCEHGTPPELPEAESGCSYARAWGSVASSAATAGASPRAADGAWNNESKETPSDTAAEPRRATVFPNTHAGSLASPPGVKTIHCSTLRV